MSINISVVVPTFNRDDFLNETINSLCLIPEINEIIIVDDGSINKIDNNFAKSNTRIVVIRNNSNLGESASVNIGIQQVTNHLVAIISDDDPQPENWLQPLLRMYRKHPTAGVFVPHYFVNTRPEMKSSRKVEPKQYSRAMITGLLICPAGPGALINLRAVKTKPLRDEKVKFPSDLVQWLRIAEVADFIVVPESIAFWREHPNQGVNKYNNLDGIFQYQKNIITWLKNSSIENRERSIVSLFFRISQLIIRSKCTLAQTRKIYKSYFMLVRRSFKLRPRAVVASFIWVVFQITRINLKMYRFNVIKSKIV
jgi:glycosyltransferase involved in cell wall biosynthesis